MLDTFGQSAVQTFMVTAALETKLWEPAVTDQHARFKRFLLSIIPGGLALATRTADLQFLAVWGDLAVQNAITWLESSGPPFMGAALMIKAGRVIADAVIGTSMLKADPVSPPGIYLLTQAGLQTFSFAENTVKSVKEHVPVFLKAGFADTNKFLKKIIPVGFNRFRGFLHNKLHR